MKNANDVLAHGRRLLSVFVVLACAPLGAGAGATTNEAPVAVKSAEDRLMAKRAISVDLTAALSAAARERAAVKAKDPVLSAKAAELKELNRTLADRVNAVPAIKALKLEIDTLDTTRRDLIKEIDSLETQAKKTSVEGDRETTGERLKQFDAAIERSKGVGRSLAAKQKELERAAVVARASDPELKALHMRILEQSHLLEFEINQIPSVKAAQARVEELQRAMAAVDKP